MLTLHQLRLFLVLADILHFGKAARKMGISQAALSRTVGKLEEDLGFLLFDRGDRHAVHLTEAGADYAVRCRRLLAELSEAESAARLLAKGDCGAVELQISAQAARCQEILTLLTDFHHAYPGIRLQIGAACSGECMQEALLRREIHAGIISDDWPWIPSDGIIRQEIARYNEKIMLMFPDKHPALTGHFPQSMQNSHFLLPGAVENSGVARLFCSYFVRQFRREPVISMEVEDSVCLQHLAAAGVGIGVLTAGEVLPVLGSVLKELPLLFERKVWLVSRGDDQTSVIKNLRASLLRNR